MGGMARDGEREKKVCRWRQPKKTAKGQSPYSRIQIICRGDRPESSYNSAAVVVAGASGVLLGKNFWVIQVVMM